MFLYGSPLVPADDGTLVAFGKGCAEGADDVFVIEHPDNNAPPRIKMTDAATVASAA